MMLIAAAGPLSNFLQAVIGLLLWAVVMLVYADNPQDSMSLQSILLYYIQINMILGVFNLGPLHPLDGGKVYSHFMSLDLARRFDEFCHQYALMLLIAWVIVFQGIAPVIQMVMINGVFNPMLSLFS